MTMHRKDCRKRLWEEDCRKRIAGRGLWTNDCRKKNTERCPHEEDCRKRIAERGLWAEDGGKTIVGRDCRENIAGRGLHKADCKEEHCKKKTAGTNCETYLNNHNHNNSKQNTN